MVAKICSHGTSSRSTAGKIYPALSKLRDQLQSRGRHGAPLHRETKRHRFRETVERIWQASRRRDYRAGCKKNDVISDEQRNEAELVAVSPSMFLIPFASFSMNGLNRSESC